MKSYQNKIFIIGSGPSTNFDDLEKIRKSKIQTIQINNSAFCQLWCDYMYQGDKKWWNFYGPVLNNTYSGIKISKYRNEYSDIQYFPDNLKKINSGQLQIHFQANYLNKSEIYLIGFDGPNEQSQKHWHPDHTGQDLTNALMIDRFQSDFDRIEPYIRNKKIINTSLNSVYDFEKRGINDVLRKL